MYFISNFYCWMHFHFQQHSIRDERQNRPKVWLFHIFGPFAWKNLEFRSLLNVLSKCIRSTHYNIQKSIQDMHNSYAIYAHCHFRESGICISIVEKLWQFHEYIWSSIYGDGRVDVVVDVDFRGDIESTVIPWLEMLIFKRIWEWYTQS